MHGGFGVKKGEHISGAACHEYLRQYAGKYDLMKRALLEKNFRTVARIEKVESDSSISKRRWTRRAETRNATRHLYQTYGCHRTHQHSCSH